MAAEEKKTAMSTGHKDMPPNDANVVVPLSAVRAAGQARAELSPAGETHGPHRSPINAREVLLASRVTAGLIAFAWVVAWPVGSTAQHVLSTGAFALRFGYTAEMAILAFMSVAMILFLGWAVSAGLRIEATARHLTRSLADAGAQPGHPQSQATRSQVSALNAEIDGALKRLAEAESLIRQQVKAINSASSAIETGAVKSTDRLERERKALMDLTEEMNREAEGFAQKIAERSELAATAQDSREKRIEAKEKEFEAQMRRLEAVSQKSLDRFEQLASAMENRGNELSTTSAEVTERQTVIAAQIEESTKRISTAQAELAEQSARLESLIKDQRKRADRLAKIVTEQATRVANRPSADSAPVTLAAPALVSVPVAKPAPASPQPSAQPTATGQARRQTSWRDILAQVEGDLPTKSAAAATVVTPDAPPRAPQPPAAPRPPKPAAPETLPAAMDQLVHRLHYFSLVVQTQLFGAPSHEDLARFERGERQLFARALTAGSTEDLRQCISDEVARNAIFRERVQEFLRDFDSVLEPLSTEEGGEAAIETYLTSPIGRLYIVTGTAVDHFA